MNMTGGGFEAHRVVETVSEKSRAVCADLSLGQCRQALVSAGEPRTA